MAGIDHILSKSLSKVIRQNLGEKTLQKIEDRLFEKYGISFSQAMEEFNKLDFVLREFFGGGTDGLEAKFLNQLCIIKQNKSNGKWLTINDSYILNILLQAIGDEDKKKILESTSSKSKVIYEILKESGVPQTSGYRKIKSLIDDGLLIQSGFLIQKDKKKVNKYLSVFDTMKINIDSDSITVDVHLGDKKIEESSLLQTIFH